MHGNVISVIESLNIMKQYDNNIMVNINQQNK